jgi:FkbM family methyltransferase
VRLSATGIEVADREFSGLSRLVLRAFGRVPSRVTDRLLFCDLPGATVMQKAMQRLLGSPRFVRIHFTTGPLAGYDFDCWTAERYFLLGAGYEAALTDVLGELVRPGDVVYDIGAHAGFSALMFARLATSTGRVYAFEPSPLTFERLRHNVALNDAPAVTLVNAGAWDSEGRLRLTEKSSWSRVIDDGATTDVPVSDIHLLRLDDFAYRDGQYPATLLKIDIEGNAARCLAGAREMLRCARPRVLLEIHDAAEARDCRAILRDHGYELQALGATARYPYHLLAGVPAPAFSFPMSAAAETP